MTSFLVDNFAIFHNFVFPLPFEIDFSKIPFDDLKSKSDITGILRLKEKKEEAILKSPDFNSKKPTYCDSINDYYEANDRLFSPNYFLQEKNCRLFFEDLQMDDNCGKQRTVRINVLLDSRGIVTINFYVEYAFESGKDSSCIVEELFHPHKNKALLWNAEDGKKSKLDFKALSQEYLKKVKGIIPKEATTPKKKELSIAEEELAGYYEPYAIEIINGYTQSLYGKIISQNKPDLLKILFWEESIEKLKTEVMERLFDDVSGRKDYHAYFSPESTLFISNTKGMPVEKSDVISMLINIEVLLMQKLLLQLYDQIVNNNLREIREKRISPSRTVEFRNNVTRDMEELFDIRIKKYQRGRVITDIGRRILNLDSYSADIYRKIEALDGLISLRHNLFMEGITFFLTILGIVAGAAFSLIQLLPAEFHAWVILLTFISMATLVLLQLKGLIKLR